MPVLASDAAGPDEGNLQLVTDARASHFWDAGGALSRAVRELLRLPPGVRGWDLYLADGAGALWSGQMPPAPAFWQHQLNGFEAGERLDPASFRARLAELVHG